MKQEAVLGFTCLSVKWTAATDTVSINNWMALLIQMRPEEIQNVIQIVLCKRKKFNLMLKQSAGVEYAITQCLLEESLQSQTEP